MFTWICPKCGREVPPAYDECPDCAGKGNQPEQAPAATGPAATAVQTAAPPPAAAAPPVTPMAPPPVSHRQQQPPPAAAAPARNGLNTVLLSVVFALAFVGLGAGVYWGVNYFRDRGQSASSQPAPLENASAKGKAAANPLQRYIEVTGVRFLQDAKKNTEVRFLVVNHSPDDITDLGGTVNIWGRTQKSEEEAVGTFVFKLPSIGAFQSKEMAAPVKTKLRVYELPDWQNVTADLQITSP